MAVAGHSFGGGTSLGLVLREAESRSLASCGKSAAERNTSVRGAILFDGWMFPLKGSEGPAFDRVIPPQRFDASVPVLFINAEMWHGSEPYFMCVVISSFARSFVLCCLVVDHSCGEVVWPGAG